MIFTAANTFEDICERSVGDFGSGPGMLSIASSLMGTYTVTGFEVDADAIETCWVNLQKMEVGNVDVIQTDVQSINLSTAFDTVVMNPPFGTRNAGIDSAFVLKGMKNANVVYSLHKTSTREVLYSFYSIPYYTTL